MVNGMLQGLTILIEVKETSGEVEDGYCVICTYAALRAICVCFLAKFFAFSGFN